MRKPNLRGEQSALRHLAGDLTKDTLGVLKRLAKLATQLCDAGSAGVSTIEELPSGGQVFRWRALAGEVEQYEGGTAPRDWSPCGACLAAGKPRLYSYPARYFTYFQELKVCIVEGLVIPMYVEGSAVATIWILSHDEQRRFDAEDVRLMTSLGRFAGAAMRLELIRPSSGSTHEIEPQLAPEPAGLDRVDRESIWRVYVRRIAHGDYAALSALRDETGPLLFTTALRIVDFAADAEEVAADVYLRVWQAASTYDGLRGSVVTWLVTIARNLAFDRLRSCAARNQSETALCIECRSGMDLERNAVISQQRGHLVAALQSLPFDQRQALELAYFMELSHTEIAERLGEPLGTVKTRIRTGLMRLRRLLAAAT